MIERITSRGPSTTLLVAACLVATVAASAVASWMDVLPILLGVLLALGALAAAMLRPVTLFYAYCAAIPLNDVLPPGPAGTVARIAGLVFIVGYLVREPGCLRPSAVPLVGWVFVGWTLASCLWAVNSELAFSAWLTLAQLFGTTVLVASLVAANPKIIRNALWSYATTATLTALIAILSSLQGAAFFSTRAAAFGDQSPAVFASLILPATIFLMGEVQSRATGPRLRVVELGALVACVVALGLSGTRSAWLGVILATVIWLILQREPRQGFAVAGLALGVMLLVFSVPGAADFLTERVGSSIATGGSGRTDIWAVGLGILATAPVFGMGFGNFSVAFTPYAIAQVAGADPGGAGRGAHNVLLGAFVEIGVVGGFLLVAFFVSALVQPNGDRIGNVIRVALISLFVQSMFTEILLRKQLWLFLAISFGMAAARRIDAVSMGGGTPHGWPIKRAVPTPRRM